MMGDQTAAPYIETHLNFVFQNIYLQESEIISKRKVTLDSRQIICYMER
jgi:hypothetical protein